MTLCCKLVSLSVQFFCRVPVVNLLSEKDDASHKAIRKPIALAFGMDSLREHAFPVALTCFERFQKRLDEEQKSNPSGVVNIDKLLQLLLFDFTGKWGFGLDFHMLDGDNEELLDAFHHCMQEFTLSIGRPFRQRMFKLLPFLPEAKVNAVKMGKVYDMYDRLAAAVRSKGVPKNDDFSLWACLSRMTQKNGSPLPDLQFKANTAGLLVAGFDTTSHQVGWLLYAIARYPEVQSSIRDELIAAGLAAVNGKPPRQVFFSELPTLQYINAVVKEAMRWRPVSANGSFRQTTQDLKLNGVLIPARTILHTPFYVVHNSRHIVEQPERFLPERWLPGSGTAPGMDSKMVPGIAREGERVTGLASKTMVAFSHGPRDCVGQNLAMMLMRLFTVLLCGHYWFEVAPEMGDEEDVRKGEQMALVLLYQPGIKLRCIPHDQRI